MKKLKLKENEVVHCATLKQAKKVLKIAHELGLTWRGGESYIKNDQWNDEKENTCYCLNEGLYDSVEFYKLTQYIIINSKEFIKRHKKASLKKRIKALEAIVNGANETYNEVEQPQIGDVVKAWDNDKSKFVYGVLNHVEPYVIGNTYYVCVEKVTEISINDFKK